VNEHEVAASDVGERREGFGVPGNCGYPVVLLRFALGRSEERGSTVSWSRLPPMQHRQRQFQGGIHPTSVPCGVPGTSSSAVTTAHLTLKNASSLTLPSGAIRSRLLRLRCDPELPGQTCDERRATHLKQIYDAEYGRN
jgi:hypothetical protein